MKRTIKSEAVVLRRRSLPNQDKIITFFTKELGKISVFAKGIKKITSRRLPHVQIANMVNVELYKKEEKFYLQETNLISGFWQIKKEQKKLKLLYQFFFVIERLLPESQTEPEVYNLLIHYLVELAKSKNSETDILPEYLNRTLRVMGYATEDRSYEDLIWSIEEIIHEKIPTLEL